MTWEKKINQIPDLIIKKNKKKIQLKLNLVRKC